MTHDSIGGLKNSARNAPDVDWVRLRLERWRRWVLRRALTSKVRKGKRRKRRKARHRSRLLPHRRPRPRPGHACPRDRNVERASIPAARPKYPASTRSARASHLISPTAAFQRTRASPNSSARKSVVVAVGDQTTRITTTTDQAPAVSTMTLPSSPATLPSNAARGHTHTRAAARCRQAIPVIRIVSRFVGTAAAATANAVQMRSR